MKQHPLKTYLEENAINSSLNEGAVVSQINAGDGVDAPNPTSINDLAIGGHNGE